MKAKNLTYGAMIAAIYTGLTLLLTPMSFGPVQCRLSEIMCILPMFNPSAIWGLFAGCLIANIYTGSLLDIILGSLTTLLAAFLTYKTRKNPYLAISFPVILNALIVGGYLALMYQMPVWLSMVYVGVGQAVACYGFGLPLYFILRNKVKSEK